MLRPTDIENLKGSESRYAFVVGVAKRARDIAEKAEAANEILTEKTVSMAIQDLAAGDYKLIVPHTDDEEK